VSRTTLSACAVPRVLEPFDLGALELQVDARGRNLAQLLQRSYRGHAEVSPYPADFGSVRSKAVLGGLHHEYSLAPA
jgi:hypothetical protein